MKKIKLTESELTRLIQRVVNEAETANCKCCKAGVDPIAVHPPIIAAAEKQRVLECCKGCKDEGGRRAPSRRRVNEQKPGQGEEYGQFTTDEESFSPLSKFIYYVQKLHDTVDKIEKEDRYLSWDADGIGKNSEFRRLVGLMKGVIDSVES